MYTMSVYLVDPREWTADGQQVFKVGQSRVVDNRLRSYGAQSHVLLVFPTLPHDPLAVETHVKRRLTGAFGAAYKGTERFVGLRDEVIRVVRDACYEYLQMHPVSDESAVEITEQDSVALFADVATRPRACKLVALHVLYQHYQHFCGQYELPCAAETQFYEQFEVYTDTLRSPNSRCYIDLTTVSRADWPRSLFE